MGVTRQNLARALDAAADGLASLLSASEVEINSLTAAFQQLAGQAGSVLGFASAIVDSIESDGVTSALPCVRTLGAAAACFVEARLQATQGILETAATEMNLLHRLAAVSKCQSVIALKTRVLTMMINVEVGRLGADGAGFGYLATELVKFSQALNQDTDELECHTAARRLANQATQSILAAEIPLLAEEFARIEVNLGDDMAALESGLMTLAAVPLQFKSCVAEIAQLTAGVIAAVQSYDITRQQIEHVQSALKSMSSSVGETRWSRHCTPQERTRTSTGITIQIYQLKHVRETVVTWTSQIRSCLAAILQVSASELKGIAPMVLEHEREVSAKLAHVELLERQSMGLSKHIRETVGDHSSLVELIDRQVKQARAVRQMLHLLSLNSIVEASRLGVCANPILQIGNGISELSAEWSRITDRSEQSMQEIRLLVERVGDLMATFSDTGDRKLGAAQTQIRVALPSLRGAADFADGQTREIERALVRMQAMSVAIGSSGDALDAAHDRIDSIIKKLQDIQCELKADKVELDAASSESGMEQMFSASYTTEAERDVMQAALCGAALPPVQNMQEGNGVELF